MRLERVRGRIAFGFSFNISSGTVGIQQAAKYVRSFEEGAPRRPWKCIRGSNSFVAPHVLRATLVGFFVRVLDMATQGRDGLVSQLTRLVWETQSSGLSDKLRHEKCVMAWSTFPELDGVLAENPEEADVASAVLDMGERVGEAVEDGLLHAWQGAAA